MKELEIIIKPEKLETVKSILDEFHCGGMTISSVMGCGTQRGNIDEETNVIKGMKTNINLLPKIRVEVVVDEEKVENLIARISEKVATGNAGDGKIFIRSIEEVVRIRTGERGKKAL
ncbi:MAG: P-II family nitrogen regulator [Lachnospiraceae bacterium]|nr:P-II family nitrogen regulator [Lachnospiraceae bacterium]